MKSGRVCNLAGRVAVIFPRQANCLIVLFVDGHLKRWNVWGRINFISIACNGILFSTELVKCNHKQQQRKKLSVQFAVLRFWKHITLCSLTFHRKSNAWPNLPWVNHNVWLLPCIDSFAMVRSRSATFSYNVKQSLLTSTHERKPTSQKSTPAPYTTGRN